MTQRNMKENQHVQPVVNVEKGTVTFNVKGHTPLVLEMGKLHPSIVARAAMVGMAQVRIVDAAAVGMTDDEGNIIPEAERIAQKHSNMAALVEHYMTGTAEWSRVGTGGGGGRSITIEAISRVKGIDYDAAKAMVERHAATMHKGDTKKALAHLRGAKAVAEAILAIRAERAPTAKVDADAILDEMK